MLIGVSPYLGQVTMPTAPPRVCNRCGQPAPARQRCACRPAWEHSTHIGGKTDMRMRRSMNNYRASHLMCEHPHCHRIMHVVDHVTPLAEGGDRYSWANYQSLCQQHHDQKTTADALRGKTRAR